ncbi:MAG: ABC transporter substrate-binding protein [Alphaproteobacteria bacterium]|nr:ABC transporter substrate-binding protein [Alphaproteobacteria bacterium]
MRYATKFKFLSGAALLAAGFLATAAMAQEATIAFSADELGSTSYNPVTSSNLNSAASLIYDRLVEQDADQSYHPHLATSWDEAPDGMSWTFHLKDGVKFHDGTPFNAQSVADWIPDFAGTENAYLVAAIDKVEVIDNLTVKFVMKRPEPNLLYNLSSTFMGIPGQASYDKLGDDFGVTAAVGTGPFKLKKFDIGLDTVLVRNDDYAWASDLSKNQGAAYLKQITFREIPDQSTAFLELKTGGLDMLLGVPTDFLKILKKEKNIAVIQMPGTGIYYMPINVTSAPFTDIRVREATGLAINQEAIVASIYNGVGAPAHNFLISSLPAANVNPALNVSYDPEKAKALLDAAGWVMGSDGVRMKDGKPLKVKLFTQNGTEFTSLTQVIQAQLADIGMQADITVFDSSTIRDEYKSNQHQLAVRSYDWNNADILDWFFSGKRLGYPNVSMWNDPEGQRLNDIAMEQSKTAAERSANFKTYHEYILSQYLFVPIYQPTKNIAYNTDRITVPAKVRGTRFRSQTVLDMNVVK